VQSYSMVILKRLIAAVAISEPGFWLALLV
jgi:hypothetical protein